MNGLEVGLRLLAGVALIAANAVFVATEFALTRVRQYDESAFDAPGLRRAWEMTTDLEIYLTSCQVGISATSIAVGIIAEPALSTVLSPLFENTVLASIGAAGLVAFGIINLLHLTHGEQTPTYLGVERTRFVARYGTPFLYWFTKLIYPAIWVGDGVAKWTLRLFGVEMTGAWLETNTDRVQSRAELRHRLTSLLDSGDLPRERMEEVLNAFTIGEIPIADVMTHAEDVAFLSTTESVDETLDRIGASPHTRFPVLGADGEPVGVIYVPTIVDAIDDLRAGETTLESLAVPLLELPAEMHVSDAVDRLQDEGHELAVVVDDGELVGLITATDVLEAVVGDIEDPLEIELGGPK
ncbi:CNNM domain-containing protein [Halohasta salina]|uniref:CNNM domain-containing protein n=1 Tax=Halohasta salina TaxID=2961621 RepID=UPI0020A24967|nr:hemolysin family protein [Halohasta salina]